MNRQGVFFGDPLAYAWLEARRPLAVLGYRIAIYDITDDADAHAALARMYAPICTDQRHARALARRRRVTR